MRERGYQVLVMGFQMGFHLVEKSSINANVVGASSTFNIRLTDRFGANVPDGTVVRFSATHGSVQGNLQGGTTSQFCTVTDE